jgi:hypothetical protein
MSQRSTNLSQNTGQTTVFVGAHVPLGLFQRLVEEAAQAQASRSEVIRRALAERYGSVQEAECKGEET